MNQIVHLLCEGETQGSLDPRLLNKLKPNNVRIIAMGGKYSVNSFLKGYMTNNAEESKNYLVFRDRDFDQPVPDEEKLTQATKNKKLMPIFMGYKACIENYLLHPQTLFEYIQSIPDKNRTQKAQINSLEDATAFFVEIGNYLRYYSAARYAIGEIRKPFEFEKKTTWTGTSGKLPKFEEMDSVSNAKNGQNFIATYQSELQTYARIYDVAKFDGLYKGYVAKFDTQFIESLQFLSWFHGKDIAAAMIELFKCKGYDFSTKLYYTHAIDHFDYTKFKDLVELQKKLIELTQNI